MSDIEDGFELLVQWPRRFRTGDLAGLAPNTANRSIRQGHFTRPSTARTCSPDPLGNVRAQTRSPRSASGEVFDASARLTCPTMPDIRVCWSVAEVPARTPRMLSDAALATSQTAMAGLTRYAVSGVPCPGSAVPGDPLDKRESERFGPRRIARDLCGPEGCEGAT